MLVIGCGSGETPAAIKERLPGSWVAGVEADRSVAMAASSRCDEVLVLPPDAGLPYPEAWFDAVVIEPKPDVGSTLPTARRLLRAGGLIVGTISSGTRREAIALFAQAGLEVTSLQLVRDFAVPWRPLPLDGDRCDVDTGRTILKGLTAGELEELGAQAILLTAVPAWDARDAPLCSIVVSTPKVLPESTLNLEVVVAESATAAARNEAARRARGEYLVFLDGALVPEEGWLEALVATAGARDGVGAVGSKLLRDDRTVEHAGIVFGPTDIPGQVLPYRIYRGVEEGAPYVNRTRSVPAVSGAAMLVPRRVFVDVGGFDDAFTHSFADVDLCLRLRAHGLRVLYSPQSVLCRAAGADEIDAGDLRYLTRKWHGRLRPDDELVYQQDNVDVRRARAHGLAQPQRPAAAKPAKRGVPLPVVWSSVLTDRSGYAEEARNFVLALDEAGVAIHVNPLPTIMHVTRLRRAVRDRLEALAQKPVPGSFIHVVHQFPAAFGRDPKAALNVGRTMFETDRIPLEWVPRCNRMDEIWVPSAFNVTTFAESGVDPEKLHRIPEALDLELFDPAVAPLRLAGLRGFVFLSVFDWCLRKGWDALVRAYVEEFRPDENVTLALKVFSGEPERAHFRRELERFVWQKLRRDPSRIPRIVVLDTDPGAEGMARLYRAADAYVMPSRGEGWGRPYMEAMAVGLPTIGTRWSGNLDFMTDENSYLIDCEVVPVPEEAWPEIPALTHNPSALPDGRGHRWAEPSVGHLRSLLRHVFEDRDEAAARAQRGRDHVRTQCSRAAVAAAVIERLRAAGRPPLVAKERAQPAVSVAWEGPQHVNFGMAVVNRELCRELADSPRIALDVLDGGSVPKAPPQVHVRSEWPPNFERPNAGHWVMVQPWEYGSLPEDWIGPMNDDVDEIWVPSSYVRDCYVASGVDPAKVVVVPNGVDPDRFHPTVPPARMATEKRWRFLFVGGTIARKGADILLDTYVRTFGPDEDVSLVVKDLGADSFYRDQGLHEQIARLQDDPAAPEILYIDDELSDDELAGLYSACQCLVHPYRGEGFGLPIAEAMACGLPVIVPAFGPSLDFCDASSAYLVPVREFRHHERRVGELATVDYPWGAEVDRGALASAMRHVVERPDEARAVGLRAAERVRTGITWERAADIALGRMEVLAAKPARRRKRVRRERPRLLRKGLSVCMIVRDEERALPGCLESIRGVADELIVVDTGSSDRTVEIARAYGAQVHEFPWNGSFAAARNESIEHATKEWVLVFDADMRLDPSAHGEIRRLIQTDELVGYMLRQLNYMNPEGTESVVEHLNLRLFPNHPELRYAGLVHEQVVPGAGLAFRAEACAAVIHHEGNRPPHFDPLKKAERDRVALEQMVRDEPGNAFHAFNLGVAYHVLDKNVDAERELSRAIALLRAQELLPPFILSAYVALALALMTLQRDEEAAAACRAALELAPDFADAHATLAAAYIRLGRLDSALESYARALETADRPAYSATDRSLSGWKALLGMGEIYIQQRDWSKALECLAGARGLSPRNPAVLLALARAWEGVGRPAEAGELARQAAAFG